MSRFNGPEEYERYITANRAAWEEVAPLHRQHIFAKLVAGFKQPGFHTLDSTATNGLARVGIQNKRVCQLGCHNGRELLSMMNLGAESVVGFDIAQAFIDQAHELSHLSGIKGEFVCSDVYRIPTSYDDSFDLVFISSGVLGYLPDISRLFGITRRLLRQQGWLMVYEIHPMLEMFLTNDDGDPPTIRYSYFHEEPIQDKGGLDYFAGSYYEGSFNYYFHRKLSDVVGAVLKSGFQLRALEEFAHDVSGDCAHFQKKQLRPALSYLLLGETA
jgi:SAM-dependent methyltransferase